MPTIYNPPFLNLNFGIKQTGTAAPTGVVVVNELSKTDPSWTRIGVGIYRGHLVGGFPEGKTYFPQILNEDAAGVLSWDLPADHLFQVYRVDDDNIEVAFYDAEYVGKELSAISNDNFFYFEVRVVNP